MSSSCQEKDQTNVRAKYSNTEVTLYVDRRGAAGAGHDEAVDAHGRRGCFGTAHAQVHAPRRQEVCIFMNLLIHTCHCYYIEAYANSTVKLYIHIKLKYK